MLNHRQKYQTNFNHYPKYYPNSILRPESHSELLQIKTNCTVRGMGNSYSDAALTQHNTLLLTEKLDRFLVFDRKEGILHVEAGVSLKKIIDTILPFGWFLPVTPGTANVTIGGCIASDVHGKNHYFESSMGHHLIALELIIATGDRVTCTPTVDEELFWATLGGMGLTGIISSVTLKLKPIHSAYLNVSYQTTLSLTETFDYFLQAPKHEYEVAWLDFLNESCGQSVIMKAEHADVSALNKDNIQQPFKVNQGKIWTLPCYLPSGLLHTKLVKIFNNFYFQSYSKKKSALLSYNDFFYPLDKLKQWPKLYGKQGFIQYQCVVPYSSALETTKTIYALLLENRCPIFLAVLKRLEDESPAFLSFPKKGLTLAFDFPISKNLFNCLETIDEIVINAKGRVYLAKDTRLKPEAFRKMYPRYENWLKVKREWDAKNRFQSMLSERLQMN